MSKELMITSLHSNERKNKFKSKGFVKRTITTALISKKDKEISKNLYKWLKGDCFKELESFYENFKEKENVSQRRKDQTKMLFNQYEKIRRIYTKEDYIGSRTP